MDQCLAKVPGSRAEAVWGRAGDHMGSLRVTPAGEDKTAAWDRRPRSTARSHGQPGTPSGLPFKTRSVESPVHKQVLEHRQSPDPRRGQNGARRRPRQSSLSQGPPAKPTLVTVVISHRT